jgi:serine/threonine protein kinase
MFCAQHSAGFDIYSHVRSRFFSRDHPIHPILRGDLHARIPYTEQQAANVTKQIMKAISYLHSKSIIHRDIKFENVIFESDHPEAVIKVSTYI